MTLNAFMDSLRETAPPAGLGRALQALWHDANGDWAAAHELAQAQGDRAGAWVHAYLHRKEGDADNAAYWYGRAGEPVARGPLDEEWGRVVEQLLAEAGGPRLPWVGVTGVVVRGHGVASGASNDPRFPGGTISIQRPFFRRLGLDLGHYYPATINLSIAPRRYRVREAKYTFRRVKWSPAEPPEDFSFFDCRVVYGAGPAERGLIYYPHTETKPTHFQPADVLEVITRYIEGVSYGTELVIELDGGQIDINR